MAFFADGDAVEIERRAVDDGRGAAGGLDGRVEHWVHVSFLKNADAHRAYMKMRAVNDREREKLKSKAVPKPLKSRTS
jgi:hypothetical protein